ncbi:hypothetical protein DERP_014485, partial [Dermatophagoides pteronyssinus]
MLHRIDRNDTDANLSGEHMDTRSNLDVSKLAKLAIILEEHSITYSFTTNIHLILNFLKVEIQHFEINVSYLLKTRILRLCVILIDKLISDLHTEHINGSSSFPSEESCLKINFAIKLQITYSFTTNIHLILNFLKVEIQHFEINVSYLLKTRILRLCGPTLSHGME